ncbi:interferon-induced very large GTPase 1-like [Hemicordylus capensis]|uniref:interferon-induced very large GTPase 1-like n=1 Tax=Hemicordylus capensis TaxID=884348 RepID=UPI00230360C0|nr:interferon-induced very large GTPase 1-like [Hemicordylus capensis]
MSYGKKAFSVIKKARRKLVEALSEIDSELILDAAESYLLFTKDEYVALKQIKNPQDLVENLIDVVLGKEESTHTRFLDCLEILRHVFPSVQAISEYVEDGPLNLRNEPQTENIAVSLKKRSAAERLDAAMSLEKEKEAENLDPPLSSETGWEDDCSGTVTMPPEKESRAGDPDGASRKNSEVKDLDTSHNRNGAKELGASATCLEKPDRAGYQESTVLSETGSKGENTDTAVMPSGATNSLPSSGKGGATVCLSSVGSREKGNAENLDPPLSSETGWEDENSGTVTMPPEKESRAGDPDGSSRKNSGVKDLDTSHNRNGAKELGASATCLEKADRARYQESTVLSEMGSKGEYTDPAVMPSGTRSRTRGPNFPPSCGKGSATACLSSVGSPEKENGAPISDAALPKETESVVKNLEARDQNMDSATSFILLRKEKEDGNLPLPLSSLGGSEFEIIGITETESRVQYLEARMQNLDEAMSLEKGSEAENMDSSLSFEVIKEVESTDFDGQAENPELTLLSRKGCGVKNQDAPNGAQDTDSAVLCPEKDDRVEKLEISASRGIESKAENPSSPSFCRKGSGTKNWNSSRSPGKGNWAEIPGTFKEEERGPKDRNYSRRSSSPVRRENAEKVLDSEPHSLKDAESLAEIESVRNVPVSTLAGRTSFSRKTKECLERESSSERALKGPADSLMTSANDIISKGRKQVIEILQKDLDMVLDELLSQSVITEEDYETLDKIEGDAKKKSRKLLLLIQKRGETACCQFLERLEVTCPWSTQALQFLVHGQPPVQSLCHSGLQSESLQEHLIPEAKAESPRASEGTKYKDFKEGRKALEYLLTKLELCKHKSKKLVLREVLDISSGSLKESTPHTLGDLPWHFLRNILVLNATARNTSLDQGVSDDQGMRGKEEEERADERFSFTSEMTSRASVNPLDVLCAVLISSDSFLQQEIFSKMSMCQFALPFLLPPLETPKCTLMLWAMRDIVKRWTPHSLADSKGFREESLVLTSMPTISFVRLGNSGLSKSKLLNEILSPSQQHYDFFIHRDMECGNIPREIADGLVEMAWYFPGQKRSDLFPEPVAFANLRGDAESHWVQFRFLTEVSSAIFIFAECISEREYALLSSLKESSTHYYFILERNSKKSNETRVFFNKLVPVLKSSQLLEKSDMTNTATFVGMLRSAIRSIVSCPAKSMSVQEMAAVAPEVTIQVDEDCEECQNALRCADQITQDVTEISTYKTEMLKLQGELWKNLAKVEKELCRMEKQGDIPSEKYRSELKGKLLKLRAQQNECHLTSGLTKFINGIKHLKLAEKHYFLKWMKFNLDHIARESLSKLRAEYKEKCKDRGDDGQKISEIDKLLSSSSLGVEHFIRELGQFYEAECSMVKGGNILKGKRQFVDVPRVAADLILEGFPLELIDGDASNIPLQWITDVLTELNHKVGGRSKMVVITVLGVQSTGKSTLLNTMFGLQFAVSSGRCTRGAFMTLLKVRENMTQELGCDFILVIDTEGLKAPELAQLEESYQHDNELATLVIGLSDITIVNMAMENATEMKDVLQIVTHAFLRMENIGQRTNCQFVHQNVSDVSAHDQNMRDRKHLLEQLNEMTQAAAKMEKVDRDIGFSEIIDYDPEMHNWYIPGLWHGVPPMAPVNMGYSEKIFELKKYLFEFITSRSHKTVPKDIPQFIEWVKSLWNAVKHENFIFSFRNSLIAEAYNQLSMKYSEWDWGFRREMHLWISEQETVIQNAFLDQLDHYNWQNELQQKLSCGEQQILESLKQYFESGGGNLHLIEKYREDFVRSANSLKHELESYSSNKCKEAIQIKRGRHKIDNLQADYLKLIEGKVERLLEECRGKRHKLGDEELRREFENMWTETLLEISLIPLRKREIYLDVDLYLRKELAHRGSSVNQNIQGAKCLLTYRINSFQIQQKYIHPSILDRMKHLFAKKEYISRVEEAVHSLKTKCMSYIEMKVDSEGDYDETYCGELLRIINEKLHQCDIQKLHTTACFEVDLKLHILGEAAHAFQAMHEKFIEKNNPQIRLEKLKPQYFSTFKSVYLEKDAQQIRAKDFCNQCLQPALLYYVKKRLGIEIVDNFLSSVQSIGYASRSFFQFTILKQLLEEKNFEQYVKYITAYEEFVKTWIWRQMLDHYTKNKDLKKLEQEILSAALKKIRGTLENLEQKDVGTISVFLDKFCKEMQKELVISDDSLVGVQFKNMSDPVQFSACVKSILPGLQKQILLDFEALSIKSKISKLPVKPQDEIFKRVFGCGQQCPFCKAPCEAGGSAHKEHFVAVHRPQGLWGFKYGDSKKLVCDLCSSNVASNRTFRYVDTNWEWRPYKDYRDYYPDWCIQPDPSINASDYWKFIFKEFNHDFACYYKFEPADLPEDWAKITKEHALEALKEIYNMK